MLKKIAVRQLRLGMFVNELCGSWMEHPFWRARFLLKNSKDLQRIRECGIDEVWIDVSKGLDVDIGEAMTTEQSDSAIDESLNLAMTDTPPPRPTISTEPASMAEEFKRAAALCDKSKQAVRAMFQEARMGQALDAEQMLPLVEEISASVMRHPGTFVSLARLKDRDEYTYMHSVAVCALMIALARQLGLDEEQVRDAGLAGMMHDLGKATIPLSILNKPGKLTDAEFEIMKAHPVEGARLLREGKTANAVVIDVCLHHHEKVNGSGYPDRLDDAAISLFAKMGAVCDVYDAITSNRPYKAGWDPAESIRKMTEWSQGHFDQRVFHAFVKSIGIYPNGSLVRLESGRLAIVMEQSAASLLAPVVKVFFSTQSHLHLPPEILDLSKPGCQDRIVARESAEKWQLGHLDRLWTADFS